MSWADWAGSIPQKDPLDIGPVENKLPNPYQEVFRYPLKDEEIDLLSRLERSIIVRSQDAALRARRSELNRTIKDPIKPGVLIHGVKAWGEVVLAGILDKGLLCPEFLGKEEVEDEIYFHVGFVRSNLEGVARWQQAVVTGESSPFKSIRMYMPHENNAALSFVIDSSQAFSWDPNLVSDKDHKKSRLIRFIPGEGWVGPQLVAVLGGVPSTEIIGIILGAKASLSSVLRVLGRAGMFIPIYNYKGEKVDLSAII